MKAIYRYSHILVWLVASILFPSTAHADGDTMSLKVLDRETKRPISDCRVIATQGDGKRITLITSTTGEVVVVKHELSRISFRHINYERLDLEITDIAPNCIVYLTPKQNILGKVTVYSGYSPTNRGNTFNYNSSQAASSISVIGEPDVLRHISSLPGISQGIESTLGLFVRGGNSGGNGLYFNDIPLYVSSHVMGMVSVYPPDIINNVKFHMGGLPAHKGNLSSALLDVGIKKEYGSPINGKLTLSPYLSGIYSSIPLAKERASVQVAARTSPVPFIVKAIGKNIEDMKISVYDMTMSLNWKLTSNQFLEAFFFSTNDFFESNFDNASMAQNWRATLGKIDWQGSLQNGMNLHTWGYYSNTYSAQVTKTYDKNDTAPRSQLGISSGLEEYALHTRGKYRFTPQWALDFGASFQHQLFSPANRKSVSGVVESSVERRLANDLYAIYGEANCTPLSRLDFRLGYRHIFYKSDEGMQHNFDLHALGHILLKDNVGVELTFDRMSQFYHTMEGLPTGWSLNILVPSSKSMPAEVTHQYYGGVFYKLTQPRYTLNTTLGGYYRNMNHIVSYINAINAFGFESESWEEETDIGKGKSYGVELSSSLQTERLGTTLACTLSKTDRQFPKINEGEPFPFKFDRRVIVNLQSKFTAYKHRSKKGKELEHILNTVVAYSSGNRVTIPVGYYEGVMPPYWSQLEHGHVFPGPFYNQIYDRQLMSGKNAYIMNDYFRIDLGYSFKVIGRKTVNELSLSVFNVLNRHNPYTYFREEGEWKQLSIVPIMPSIRWSMSW